MKQKLLNTEYIYCVYNKKENKPYIQPIIYNETPKKIIILITEVFTSFAKMKFSQEFFDLKKIENGKEQNQIQKFLEDNFNKNEIDGISILYDDVIIPATTFEDKN